MDTSGGNAAAGIGVPAATSTVTENAQGGCGREMRSGLTVRAPTTGQYRFLQHKLQVTQGEELLAFDDRAAKIDVERARLAADTLGVLSESLANEGRLSEAVARKKVAEDAAKISYASYQRVRDTYANLVEVMNQLGENSLAEREALGVAEYQYCEAQVTYLSAELNLKRAQWALDDFKLLYPQVCRIQDLTQKKLTRTVSSFVVVAPETGQLDYLVPATGWAERGQVLMRYESPRATPTGIAAISTQAGVLAKHLVSEGTSIQSGDLVAQFDDSDLRLEELYLALAQAQITFQIPRLEGEGQLLSTSILDAKVNALRARKDYQFEQLLRTKRLYEGGFVRETDVFEAMAAFDAVTSSNQVTENACLAAKSAMLATLEASRVQAHSLSLRAAELALCREALQIRALSPGRVHWLVPEGAFVYSGTNLAAVVR